MEQPPRRTSLHVRLLLIAIAVVGITGCSAHTATVTNPCPVVSKQGAIVVSPDRGAIGMAKVGLTPDSLKNQQNCG